MKELTGVNQNLSIAVTPDGKLTPMFEVIVHVTEPTYVVSDGGIAGKTRVTETIRFHTPAGELRRLADIFLGWADVADEVMANISVKNDDDDELVSADTI